jgi:hypothetical protein
MTDPSNSRLPRASMIVACLALFIAIGGSAYAAKDLITGKQIAENTVTSKNVKNATLKTKDLNKKTVAALQGAKGPKGDPGKNGVVQPQSVSADPLQNIAANTEADVLMKAVPAGSYVVTATVNAFSQGAGIGGCNLLANGSSVDEVGFNESAGSTNTRTSLALQAVVPAGTTQLKISCGAGATAISASHASLIAIPVG